MRPDPFFGCKSKPGWVRLLLLPRFCWREWRHFRHRYKLSVYQAVRAVIRGTLGFVQAPGGGCWWCGGHKPKVVRG